MEPGIEFEIFRCDRDFVEFRLMCSNGFFAGRATIYLGHELLKQMAERLKGFPATNTDSRDFELGTFDPKCAGGGVRMHFYCVDSVGHAAVEVRILGDSCHSMGELESVALRIPIEASGIDSFVAQVNALDTDQLGQKARLPIAGTG